jgi:hypothetical protein
LLEKGFFHENSTFLFYHALHVAVVNLNNLFTIDYLDMIAYSPFIFFCVSVLILGFWLSCRSFSTGINCLWFCWQISSVTIDLLPWDIQIRELTVGSVLDVGKWLVLGL